MIADVEVTERYRAVSALQIARDPRFEALPVDIRRGVEVLSHVLPFRTNSYVLDLIDWSAVPDDPIFQLTFPQEAMLSPGDFHKLGGLDRSQAEGRAQGGGERDPPAAEPASGRADERTTCRGSTGGTSQGLQHKYRETVLFFPAQGQTCHAYCTYCFRWPQFVGMPGLKFAGARPPTTSSPTCAEHPEVTDVLFTGGDPLIMKTAVLRALHRAAARSRTSSTCSRSASAPRRSPTGRSASSPTTTPTTCCACSSRSSPPGGTSR